MPKLLRSVKAAVPAPPLTRCERIWITAPVVTTLSTSVSADSRFTRFAMRGARPAFRSAGMITTELEPPRIVPSITACIQVQLSGSTSSQTASMATGATKRMARRKPTTASRVPRPAAWESSRSFSSLPPSKSTTTSVSAPK